MAKTTTYITRDIERAIGMDPSADFHIVCNECPYSLAIKNKFPDFVTLIKSPSKPMGTSDLITHYSEVLKALGAQAGNKEVDLKQTDLLVFKNTSRVERFAVEQGWNMINPKAALGELIETKMSQVEWLGDLGKKYLPKNSISVAKNLVWTGKPFILQWDHGHTGGGTVLISREGDLKYIKDKFPERMTRRTEYVRGPSFTVNVVVAQHKILVGNISYQITGTLPFTDNIFATVGNDWGLTHSLLNEEEIEYIQTMAQNIGKKMNISGWRGLFGIDVIRDDDKNVINLIEINARQPASTTFESILQQKNRALGVKGLTTFEAHVKALKGEDLKDELILINDGAQILQRITRVIQTISPEKVAKLEALGLSTIPYVNTMHNEDLLRIQSEMGIMETHGRFNKRGKEILDIVSEK